MTCPSLKGTHPEIGVKLQQCHLDDYASLANFEEFIQSEGDLGSLVGATLLPSTEADGPDAFGRVLIQGDSYVASIKFDGQVEFLDLKNPNLMTSSLAWNFPIDACRLVQDSGSPNALPGGPSCQNVSDSVFSRSSLEEGIYTFAEVWFSHKILKGFRVPLIKWNVPGFKFYNSWWQSARAFAGGSRFWFLNPYRWIQIARTTPYLAGMTGQAAWGAIKKIRLTRGGLGYFTFEAYKSITGGKSLGYTGDLLAGVAAYYTPDLIRGIFTSKYLLGRPTAAVGTAIASRWAGATVFASKCAQFGKAANIAGWVLIGFDFLGNAVFDDYEQFVNKRVYDIVWDNGGFWNVIRGPFHFFAPDNWYEASVASDNSELVDQIEAQDKADTLRFNQNFPTLLEMLLQSFDASDPTSYSSQSLIKLLSEPIEFSAFEIVYQNQLRNIRTPDLEWAQKEVLQKLYPEKIISFWNFEKLLEGEKNSNPDFEKSVVGLLNKDKERYENEVIAQRDEFKKTMGLTERDLIGFEQRAWAEQIQKQGLYISKVPGRHNEWADEYFDSKTGAVFKTRVEKLFQVQLSQLDESQSFEAFVPQLRRVHVASQAIMGVTEYQGSSIKDVLIAATLKDSQGFWRPGPELTIAFHSLVQAMDAATTDAEKAVYEKQLHIFVRDIANQIVETEDQESKVYFYDYLENDLGLKGVFELPENEKPKQPMIRTGSQF